MTTIEQTYTIKAPVAQVWRALTDATAMEEWGAGPATFDAQVGGAFSQWGGEVHGSVTGLVPNQVLEESWQSKDHPGMVYPVRFDLSDQNGTTVVKLTHANVGAEAEDDFTNGWKDFYFDPIQQLLEGGAHE